MIKEKSSGFENEEDKIKQALLERPRFSIKARLSLMLFILFIVSSGVLAVEMYMLSKLDNRTHYIFLADQIANEIQHARRIEKNYFLYKSDLPEIKGHIKNAHNLIERASREFGSVVGRKEIREIKKGLNHYSDLADKLIEHSGDSPFINSAEFAADADNFRIAGSKILALSLDISKKERKLVSETVLTSQRVNIALIVVSLIAIVSIVLSLTRHIISRLNRLMTATQRLAEGDFSPITPLRKYRDEFSYLAIAFNHMIYELEKQQKILVESHKLRAIGNLTAGIAHELNNPLNNIIITSEMLKEDLDDLSESEIEDMINDLVVQGERAHQVVKNLLDFARESESQAEHFNIAVIIDMAVRLVKNQVKMHKVLLKTDVDKNLPDIYGDSKQLTQVFVNLFINAIDAMPGGGTLSISAEEEKKLGFLSIVIEDSGSGIPKHLIDSIFNPFFTTKPAGKGTGLGLSVTKGIIEKHGGDISVESAEGKGTLFTVHLPIVPIPADLKSNRKNKTS